jgi:hypothetical protein
MRGQRTNTRKLVPPESAGGTNGGAVTAPPTLKRELGLGMATALVIGNMVGSGIFLLPSSLAATAGPASIFAWFLTGIGAMLLALVFARLGRAYPKTGGPWRTFAHAACGSDGDFVDLSQSPDPAWAETDELRVAERSNPQIHSYVRPEEAAEKGGQGRAQP